MKPITVLFATFVSATLALIPLHTATANTDDGSSSSSEDPALNDPAASVEVIGFEEAEGNVDYQPKSDAEGSTWTFDPTKVELTAGDSDTGTNFKGARILKGGEDVVVQGNIGIGSYEDSETQSRYGYWQGSTYYFGVDDSESENAVAGIAEFFWFESSIPRGSDFYVMHLKVKSSPNPWDKWVLAKEPNFVEDYIFFWTDIQPSQHVDVFMEPGGAHGALRWDFCVPFETYKWEPVKTMQISESYGAGYSLNGDANAQGKASQQFKEGGMVADVSGNAQIQSKGYINSDFKVQSQYTVTLYKWQMLVASGGEDIHYKLVVLPHDDENEQESGYYEYYIVIQAGRGTPVHIDQMEIGGMFRHTIPLWFDSYEGLSVSASDIWITPPRGTCLPGDIPPAGTCKQKGVCGLAEPQCIDNQWSCPIVNVFEATETTCDGLDNDCDGLVDEDIDRECHNGCGTGYEVCVDGKFQGCTAPTPKVEICGDGVDNDCDGVLDNGCTLPDDDHNGNTDDDDNGNTDIEGDPNDTSNRLDEKPFDNGSQSTWNSSSYGGGQSPQTPVPTATGGSACTSVGMVGAGTPATTMVVFASLLMLAFIRRQDGGK